MKPTVHLQNACHQTPLPNLFQIQQWVEEALREAQYTHDCELVIRLVDADEMQRLNAQYRQQNKPTNVLSFPETDPMGVLPSTPSEQTVYLGDMLLCASVVSNEAQQQKKSIDAHFAHLIIHGTLHLLGYDHIDANDASIMEALEINALANLQIANPYEDPKDDERPSAND